jgi:hypothetical protein
LKGSLGSGFSEWLALTMRQAPRYVGVCGQPKKEKTMTKKLLVLCITVGAAMSGSVFSQAQADHETTDSQKCPMRSKQAKVSSHHASVDEQGDRAMGFSHLKTSHHFRMNSFGGTIEATANDPTDTISSDAIRSHLSHVAVMFTNGDFFTPMFVHNGVPPGATTMKLLKANIHYQYKEISTGGKVLIESKDPVALAAIHDFLRFQISEHGTGDSIEVGDSQ